MWKSRRKYIKARRTLRCVERQDNVIVYLSNSPKYSFLIPWNFIGFAGLKLFFQVCAICTQFGAVGECAISAATVIKLPLLYHIKRLSKQSRLKAICWYSWENERESRELSATDNYEQLKNGTWRTVGYIFSEFGLWTYYLVIEWRQNKLFNTMLSLSLLSPVLTPLFIMRKMRHYLS